MTTKKAPPKPQKATPSRVKHLAGAMASAKAVKPAKATSMKGTSSSQAAHKLAIFKKEYMLNGGNMTQAAIVAGYSPKTAAQAGYRLFKAVEKDIAAEQAAIQTKMGLTLERTLLEVARIAYGDPRKLYDADGNLKPIKDLDDDTAATVAGIEVETSVIGIKTSKVKYHDKKGALDMAMRFHGAYDKDNHQKNMNVTIVMNDTDESL